MGVAVAEDNFSVCDPGFRPNTTVPHVTTTMKIQTKGISYLNRSNYWKSDTM